MNFNSYKEKKSKKVIKMSVFEGLDRSYTSDLRMIITGIALGIPMGLLGHYISNKLRLEIKVRIVFQLILLVTFFHYIRRYFPPLVLNDNEGNLRQFYYGVQVFLFFDLAKFFNMRIE